MGAVQIAFDFGSARAGVLPDTAAEQFRLARKLELRLGDLLGRQVTLTLTDNARTMVSARERDGIAHVRVHHMFAQADDATLRAIARFLREGHGSASGAIQRYIEQHRVHIRSLPARTREPSAAFDAGAGDVLRGSGKHHDLHALFARLNARYFDGQVSARIDWARMSRGLGRAHRRHSIKLGSYRGRDPLIRVHPVLDAAWVPAFFVEYIVYHEMLHHVIPMPMQNGRRTLHGPDFRARERQFHDYDLAIAWERENLDRLLSG
jgi:SprT-like family protein